MKLVTIHPIKMSVTLLSLKQSSRGSRSSVPQVAEGCNFELVIPFLSDRAIYQTPEVKANNTHVGMCSACTGIQNFTSCRQMARSTYYDLEFKTYVMPISRDAMIEALKAIRMNVEICKRTKHVKIR